MPRFITTILSNLIRFLLPYSFSETRISDEIFNNIMKSTAVLLVVSILLASTILLVCFAIYLYLLERGYTVFQVISLIITIKSFLIGACLLQLRNHIKKIKDLNGNSADDATKEPHYHIVRSFVDGFNSKF